MQNKNGFFSNWIVKNLLLALVLIAALVLLVNIILGIVTQHGKEISVPDFTNMSFAEARETALHAGVKVEVIDSVYVKRMQRGAVFVQNPVAGSKVKKGRRILLTINAVVPQKITMPSLVGYSMRQAKAELSSRGLTLGRLIYVSDMATNNVLKQLHQNQEIMPGVSIESGSAIDLVVGLNSEDNRTYAPDVVGMKFLRAVDAVHDHSLNVTRLFFDSNVKDYTDSLNAVVYRQSPASSDIPLTMGAGVSLYLK
ncbi:MAG TPA: PASTA domain-containing protein [Candidatus Cryptobacteroides sp.]|mgnify:FL=1|jgi:beta-lactam-binding protein with PASTA domain|nr:PASTA domain-containing protein [Candidatus Cryptobacteroides sp.]